MATKEEENKYLDWLEAQFSSQGHVVTPSRFKHMDSAISAVMVQRFAWASGHHIIDRERGSRAEPTDSPSAGDTLFLVARNNFPAFFFAKFTLRSWLQKVGFESADAVGDYTVEIPAPPSAGYCSTSLEPVTVQVGLVISEISAPSELVHVHSSVRQAEISEGGSVSTSSLTYRFNTLDGSRLVAGAAEE